MVFHPLEIKDEPTSPITDVEALRIYVDERCKQMDELGRSQDYLEVGGLYPNDKADIFPVDLATRSSPYTASAEEAMLQRLSEVHSALNEFLDLENTEGVGRRFTSAIAHYKAEALRRGHLKPYRSDDIVAMTFFLDGCVGEGTAFEIDPPAQPRSFLE